MAVGQNPLSSFQKHGKPTQSGDIPNPGSHLQVPPPTKTCFVPAVNGKIIIVRIAMRKKINREKGFHLNLNRVVLLATLPLLH